MTGGVWAWGKCGPDCAGCEASLGSESGGGGHPPRQISVLLSWVCSVFSDTTGSSAPRERQEEWRIEEMR